MFHLQNNCFLNYFCFLLFSISSFQTVLFIGDVPTDIIDQPSSDTTFNPLRLEDFLLFLCWTLQFLVQFSLDLFLTISLCYQSMLLELQASKCCFLVLSNLNLVFVLLFVCLEKTYQMQETPPEAPWQIKIGMVLIFQGRCINSEIRRQKPDFLRPEH